MTAVMLAVLVWLGTWQVHRLAWKTALLADIDRGEAAPAIPLPAAPTAFAKVYAEGTLRPGATGLYGVEVRPGRTGPQIGADALAVLDRPGQPPLLIDRGWVSTDAPPSPLPPGPIRIEGYIRPPEAAVLFGAKDDLATRRFYALDPAVIGPALGAAGVAPFTLVVMGTAPAGAPQPAQDMPRPVNNHLQYALTWYGFALTLVIIFALWTRKALRA